MAPRPRAHLPLAVPLPVANGVPEEAFPYPWSVVRWLPGEIATIDRLHDPVQAAVASRRIRARACKRSIPRVGRSTIVGRRCAFRKQACAPASPVYAAKSTAMPSSKRGIGSRPRPTTTARPVWFHGDLAYLNLLAQDGELSGVIDWGTCGVGDPAIEMIIAWSLFPADARAAFRDELGIDDATWERGKGWVLTGVFGIPYYRDTNPVLVADKIAAIEAVLAASD